MKVEKMADEELAEYRWEMITRIGQSQEALREAEAEIAKRQKDGSWSVG